jgi:hypothetical protein
MQIITDEQIRKAFENTNFGTNDFPGLIVDALSKIAQGYSTGHTIAQVISELGLATARAYDRRLTDKGWEYLKAELVKEALASLLDELPAADADENLGTGYLDGWTDYRNAVILLIQKKIQ